MDDARISANAAWVGFLPLIAINAAFARMGSASLDLGQSVVHHVYDAGQLLALAGAAWLLTLLLWRLPLLTRFAVGAAVLWAAHYALLGGDLESFIARHPKSRVPWRLVFAGVATLGVVVAVVVGRWLSRSKLRWLGVALALPAGVGNHLVLQHNYQGAHWVLACCAALLFGHSSLYWIAKAAPGVRLRTAAVVASLAGVASIVVPPGPVVRSALLGSSGAVVAPFVAPAWAALSHKHADAGGLIDPEWLAPRHGLPPRPLERLPGAPTDPIVIVLTADAFRGDLFDDPAYEKPLRRLHAMKRRSLTFSRVWSPSAYTMGTLRSFFSGIYYSQQKATAKPKKKGKKKASIATPFLAHLLADAGVATVNLCTHGILARNRSIARGFNEERMLKKSAPAKDVVAAVLERLDAHSGGPLFIYSHMLEAHAPYTRGGKKGTDKERYVAEIANVDAAIGKLRNALAKRKLRKRTYLIVSADHGEAFGEHGAYFHATTNYEEMIRIPLLIEGPGVKPRVVEQAASLIDVGPTVLSLFGIPTPAHFMGESLTPLMRGEDRPFSRPLASEGGRQVQSVLFRNRWKATIDIRRNTEEVYDLQTDPGETKNLAETADGQRYLAATRAFFAFSAKPR